MGSGGGRGAPGLPARRVLARVCRAGDRTGDLTIMWWDGGDRHRRADRESGTRTRVRNRLRIGRDRPALVGPAHSVIVVAATLVHSVIPARFGWGCPASPPLRSTDATRGQPTSGRVARLPRRTST